MWSIIANNGGHSSFRSLAMHHVVSVFSLAVIYITLTLALCRFLHSVGRQESSGRSSTAWPEGGWEGGGPGSDSPGSLTGLQPRVTSIGWFFDLKKKKKKMWCNTLNIKFTIWPISFFQLYWGIIDEWNCVVFKHTKGWFDIRIRWEMINTKLIITPITSQLSFFRYVARTLKLCPLGTFQVCNTVFLTVVTVL